MRNELECEAGMRMRENVKERKSKINYQTINVKNYSLSSQQNLVNTLITSLNELLTAVVNLDSFNLSLQHRLMNFYLFF